ncbi:hypothetical protein GCM10017710_27520 [Arthrobacter ramosus]
MYGMLKQVAVGSVSGRIEGRTDSPYKVARARLGRLRHGGKRVWGHPRRGPDACAQGCGLGPLFRLHEGTIEIQKLIIAKQLVRHSGGNTDPTDTCHRVDHD